MLVDIHNLRIMIMKENGKEIKGENMNKFDWIPIYKEIANKLLDFKNDRKPLLELLHRMKESGLKPISLSDEVSKENEIAIDDVDPYTFFANFSRGLTFDNRKAIIEYIKSEWNLTNTIPSDFEGIPVVNNQTARFFASSIDRRNRDINNLWILFEQSINNSINYVDEELFNECLNIKGVKKKLTMGLYWINPENYLPLDQNSENYLKKEFNLKSADISILKYSGYKSLINTAKEKSTLPFYEISQKAWQNAQNTTETPKTIENKVMNKSLNTILYGPPGTGKTYETKNRALNILGVKTDNLSREKVTEKYDEYKRKGQIEFVTFHQSFGYEDFIEGIKPVLSLSGDDSTDNISYEIEDGIFKKMCRRATHKYVEKSLGDYDSDGISYFKMSLGGKKNPDIHNWCIENGYAAIGWGGDNNFSNYSKIKDWKQFRDKFRKEKRKLWDEKKYTAQAVYIFTKMNIGDLIIVTKGNQKIDAIGRITGEYEYKDDAPFDYFHFRKVDWLITKLDSPVDEFISKNISQQTIYEFYSHDVKKEYIKGLLTRSSISPENFVLIIDEINRGNIASIFGELITLIEDDKRDGAEEAISTTLPYSKEQFSVPNNLYIIGTMNTADRSVEALDTALRRRFTFIEKLSEPHILSKDKYKCADIDLEKLLYTINYRIQMILDKDHQIGHSYFMSIGDKKNPLIDLQNIFKNKIIPLLEEYFYGNPSRIGLILGKNFVVKSVKDNVKLFTEFGEDFIADDTKDIYDIKIPDNLEAFRSIYE